jgi:predicted amidohydrolase YtcJ
MVSKVVASRSTSRSVSPTSDRVGAARAAWLMAAVMSTSCGGASLGVDQPAADLVLVGGAVMTVDPEMPRAEALAVRDGRIVAVGRDRDILPWIGSGTRVINLNGRSVTPGLTDAHAHLYGLGSSMDNVSLRGATSEEEAAQRAAAAATSLPAGDWLIGRGWDQNLWPKKEFPTAATLDKLVGDRPAALRRVDGHAVWVSSAALKVAGIDKDTPDPKGGVIERGAGGAPSGVLVDSAMELVESKIPEPSAQVIERRILVAAKVALEAGITCVHEMGISDRIADIYRNLADEQRLPLRIYAYLAGDSVTAEALARRVAEIDRDGSQMFVMRGVKFFVDGALGSRGARLLAPYSDDPDNSGLWVMQPGELQRAVEAATEAGWQSAIHAIGDAGVRATLDAYQAVSQAQPHEDLRLRVEHSQVVSLEDIPRFAKLGVIASMQPTHATSDMPWAEARLGAERVKGAYAWRSLLDTGAHVAFGSDFPVEEVPPLGGLYAAVTRQDAKGQPPGGWTPGERITLDEAVRAFTLEAAYAAFADKHRGQIKPGMLADLTVYDRALAPDRSLLETTVDFTIVGGKIVHERKAAAAGVPAK